MELIYGAGLWSVCHGPKVQHTALRQGGCGWCWQIEKESCWWEKLGRD